MTFKILRSGGLSLAALVAVLFGLAGFGARNAEALLNQVGTCGEAPAAGAPYVFSPVSVAPLGPGAGLFECDLLTQSSPAGTVIVTVVGGATFNGGLAGTLAGCSVTSGGNTAILTLNCPALLSGQAGLGMSGSSTTSITSFTLAQPGVTSGFNVIRYQFDNAAGVPTPVTNVGEAAPNSPATCTNTTAGRAGLAIVVGNTFSCAVTFPASQTPSFVVPTFSGTGGASFSGTTASGRGLAQGYYCGTGAGNTACATVNVTGTATATGTIAFTLTSYALGAPTAYSTDAPVATDGVITTSADVQITKTGPATATAGQAAPLSYTITLTNAGPSDAQAVALTDPLPAGTTFVSLTQGSGPTFNCTTPAVGAGGTVSCTIATLANGATPTFTLAVQLAPSAASGTLSNTATASSTTPDPNSANNSSTANTTVQTSADVQITKTGPATVNAGQTITYQITTTNNGPSDAQNVLTSDTLPSNTTLVSFVQNTGPANGGPLPAGATQTFTLVLTANANTPNGTVITNTAQVNSSTTDPNPNNNSSSVMTTVTVPSVTSCSVSPTLLTPTDGMLHQVTITISATGPFTLQSVTANQPITASDYTFVPGTSYPANTTTITGSLRAAVTAGSHGRIYALKFVPSGPAAGSSCEVTVQVRAR